MTFGEYLKQKRLDKEITLRGFAKLVDISPVYLCDLEKGRKAAPSMEVMQKMVSKLALNKEESERFYDLAALEQTAKNPIPKDLNAFLKDNHVIVSALRTAKDLDATDEEWQDFIDKLKTVYPSYKENEEIKHLFSNLKIEIPIQKNEK